VNSIIIERLIKKLQRSIKHRDKEMKNMKEMLRFGEEKIKASINIC